jgi:spore maturation protein CgeB
MNFLIIQEAGRHVKNFNFRESLNLKRALERSGHSCIVWGSGYPDFSLDMFNIFLNQSDVVLLLENYLISWVPDLSNCTKPKIFWSIDAHWNLLPHLEVVDKQKITHVLSSTSSYCRLFKRSSWFPNAYPADLISPPAEIKKVHNVGYCGNVVNRGEWITFLINNHQMKFDRMVIGQDMINAVQSYRIHWNRNVKDDINCRTFETTGSGTFLMTNYTDRLSDLFNINQHLITYDSPQDCLEKIQYFLNHPDEREEIAKKGYEHVSKWHTYDCRVKQLIDIVENKL